MPENKYLAAAIGILLIFAAAYNIYFFAAKKRQQEPLPGPQATAIQQQVPVVTKPTERVKYQEDKNNWPKDPFKLQPVLPPKKTQKLSKAPDISEGIHLGGVIQRNGKSLALINGRVYRINDRIGDVIIQDITKEGVVISSGDQIREISFKDYKLLKEKAK